MLITMILMACFRESEKMLVFLMIGITICIALPLGSVLLIGSQYEQTKLYDIYSIKATGTEVNGHFAIGFGSIKTEQYYFFYVKETDNDGMEYFTCEKANVDYTRIVETDASVPSFWKIKDGIKEYSLMYVPEGTVKIQFTM